MLAACPCPSLLQLNSPIVQVEDLLGSLKNPTTQSTELAGHFHPSPSSPSIKKSPRLKVCHIKESTPIASANPFPPIRKAPIRKAKAISISKHCPTSLAIRRSPRFSKGPTT